MDTDTLASPQTRDSGPLPPIPTPAGQHWREVRIRALPPIIFALILAGLFITWTSLVVPVSMVGQVETNTVSVITTQAGLLTDLAVNRFDEVTNGQILGFVTPYDSEQIDAQLAAIASGINVLKARMDLNELGNFYSAANMSLGLDAQRTLLNVAKVGLQQADFQVKTDEELMKKPPSVVTPLTYKADVAKRDALKSEVEDRTQLVERWVKDVETLAPLRTNVVSLMDTSIKEDILKQQEQLRQMQKPLAIRAAASGRISAVGHHAGERVPAGAAIVTITSTKADRILAYVRQPINYHPKLGDVVTVRTRTTRRRTSEAQVVRVGAQLEPIGVLLLPMGKLPGEVGLPIALTLPPELNLFPGEVVDLKVSRKQM